MKKAIPILVLLLLTLSGSAQWSPTYESAAGTSNLSYSVYSEVVHVCRDTLVVASGNNSHTGRFTIFSLNHPNLNVASRVVVLPTGMTVNDFQIYGNRVYFCGCQYAQYAITNGVIGWFNIDDMENASLTLHHTATDSIMGNSLYRMVLYEHDSCLHLAAITESPDRFPKPNTIVDVTFQNGVITSALSWRSLLLNETYTDIEATSGYVGIIGYSANQLLARRYPKGLLSGNMVKTGYYYTANIVLYLEPRITRINSNDVMVSFNTFISPNSSQRFHTFNLANMSLLNAMRLGCQGKMQVWDMVYVSSISKMAISHERESATAHDYIGDILLLNPYSSSAPSAQCLYSSYLAEVNSMDVTGNRYLIATQGKQFFVKDMQQNPSLDASRVCYNTCKYDIEEEDAMAYFHSEATDTTRASVLSIQTATLYPFNSTISSNCTHN